MYRVESVAACTGSECYLLLTDRAAVLVDSGFSFCAEKTAENIRRALGDRGLDLILLTHSHYDHAAGSATIRHAFPGVRVAATARARDIFVKPNALRLMQSLDDGFAAECGWPARGDRVADLHVDVALEDGDTVGCPGLTFRTIATPGHTRCCASYYAEELGLLICSETLGIITRYPEVAPCLIIGSQPTLDSIARCRALAPARLFVSHTGLIPEADTGLFFDNATAAVEEAVALILDQHRAGRDEDAIAAAFMDRFYHLFRGVQPEEAFRINTKALIPRLLEEHGLASKRGA